MGSEILFEERAGNLTLRRSDREVQYVFYDLRNVETKTLGPPVVALGWCDILQTAWANFTFMISASWPAVTATTRNVKAKGRRGSVLLDMELGQNDDTDAGD